MPTRHHLCLKRCSSAVLVLISATLGACASLPAAGPRSAEIKDEAREARGAQTFALVDVSTDTIAALADRTDSSLASSFEEGAAAPALEIGPGDGISLNIWEAGSDPLFAPVASNTQGTPGGSARGASIVEQIVSGDGTISLPFAGRIKVAGLSLAQAQSALEQALAGKAQKPQVLITLTRNVSNAVTVIGDGAGGARVPLSARGERVLDVLAALGGARTPSYETQIELTRDGKTVSVPLQRVLADPRENIRLAAGDLLVLTRRPQTFTAFGATGRNSLISFEAQQLNLIEAVAKAGGLQDQRADPRGIFLFRYEPHEIAQRLSPGTDLTALGARVPVVYQLDLTKAGGYFLGQSLALRDRDMLYVANAPATELEKFLQLLGLVTQPVISGVVVESTTHN